jgi:hypothetical protein
MKKLFYTGIIGLLLFEIFNVYLIMPMPGSQQMNSIDAAYFLYRWRWFFRGLFGAFIIIGLLRSNWKRKWVPVIPLIILAGVIYFFNFQMAADHMFSMPEKVTMANAANSKVDTGRLVIGVVNNGEAKAYPIRFLGFHHQVQDSVGGKPLLITYCTVCRTGRVFEPVVNGKHENFRLVGMDHFNAMLEDATTKSWWRQATGEAITGKLKGQQLPEFYSTQTSLEEWLQLNPNSLIMQADSAFINSYDTTFKYESGASRKQLTGTDSLSWKDKSWVVGIAKGTSSKAYDWNQLKEKRLIEDRVGGSPIVLVLAKNNKSFFAFDRPNTAFTFTLKNDTLLMDSHRFQLNGKGIDTSFSLMPISAYQEFWHSWRTFHPKTEKYE